MTKPMRVFAAACVGLSLTVIVALAIGAIAAIGWTYRVYAEMTGSPMLLLASIAVVVFAGLTALTYWAMGRGEND